MAIKNITKLKHRFPLRQIRHIPRFISHHWPTIALLIVSVSICYLNYKPYTYLTGWDNLHPEFDFTLNIKRSIFSVWQEYQSLGLLGGMAHASDLVRQIFLASTTSLFNLPNNTIRYFWVFLTYILGTIGTYKLVSLLLEKKFDTFTTQSASFLGALFYHLFAGIRHLFMDAGVADTLKSARLTSGWVIVSTIILTSLMGIYLW